MYLKLPKNTEKYEWTLHSIKKMKFYGLSAQRVLRVIKNPQRVEEGIVPKTVACMQKASSNKKSGEIWCMYQVKISNSKFLISNQIPNPKFQKLQTTNQKLKIISAWRYPGVSPKKDPIPEEIIREIKTMI